MVSRAFYCNECEAWGNICLGPRTGFNRADQAMLVDARRTPGVECWVVAQVLMGHDPEGFYPNPETAKFLRSRGLMDPEPDYSY